MSFLKKIFSTKAPSPASSKPVLPKVNLTFVDKLQEMMTVAEEREIHPRIPLLKGERVLHMAENTGTLNPLFLEKGAELIFNASLQSSSVKSSDDKIILIKIDSRRLPFQQESIGFILASLDSQPADRLPMMIKEMGRVLKKGGRAIVTDWHPFNPMAKKGRPSSDGTGGLDEGPIGFEKYFKLFREQSLVIGNLKEIFIDGAFRSLMKSEADKKFFQQYHSNPLALFFFLSKGGARHGATPLDRSTTSGTADHTP
ncbi:MAG: class I SAM-dependent methyltransferase [Deltaproteobacteria bacterium]|nr:class I SAM-dependent methyltransferase [Deltaproteobacteria bacterium]